MLDQKKHYMSWPVIALLDFVTIISFENIFYPFQNQGLSVVISWIFLLFTYVIPYALIATQLGLTFDNQDGGLASWIRRGTHSDLFGYITSWMYWTQTIPYLVDVSKSVIVSISWIILGNNTLGHHMSTFTFGMLTFVIILLFIMKKLGLLLIACFAFAAFASAQNNIVKSLERNVPGQGKVTIHQDARIEALIGQEYIPNGTENRVLKSQGYRVQVYAGNNTSRAKNEAHSVGSRIKEYFPELSVYTSFHSPRWLCRVGDFRSIEEADAMMRQLRATGVFKEVSIVKEQINIPL